MNISAASRLGTSKSLNSYCSVVLLPGKNLHIWNNRALLKALGYQPQCSDFIF